MGYYVNTTDVNVTIPLSKEPDALAAIKRLNDPEFDNLKGGSSTTFLEDGTKISSRYYSWMPEDFSTFTSLIGFLEEVGFQDTQVMGDHIYLGYYDHKSGQEDVFLRTLAPFVTTGGYIEWRGFGGAVYRWDFDGEKMIERTTTIVWK